MNTSGTVSVSAANKIAAITFSHPKGNSLPGNLLRELAASIDDAGKDPGIRAIVLQSAGEKTFCAGASFDELVTLKTLDEGKAFFMGFARVILAMKNCPKCIVTRVRGKAVGGALGIIAASDHVLAHGSASVRLSELSLGIGPFVIAPALGRKIGLKALTELSVSTEWRDAGWAERCGLCTAGRFGR